MKEYRILFDYRPGTKTQVPEHVFVELEDETGRSTGAGAWEGHPQPKVKKGSLVYLVLPNYEEEKDRLQGVLWKIANTPVSNDKLELLIQMAAIKSMATDAIQEKA